MVQECKEHIGYLERMEPTQPRPASPGGLALGATPDASKKCRGVVLSLVVHFSSFCDNYNAGGATRAGGVGHGKDPAQFLETGTGQSRPASPGGSARGASLAPHNFYEAPSIGPVHVDGYYRKDGTYVHPHNRNRPGK